MGRELSGMARGTLLWVPMARWRVRFLIAGFGSIGRRHFRNLQALGYNDLLIWRARGRAAPPDESAAQGALVFRDLEAALAQRPDVVIVANPTSLHLPVSRAALRHGSHVLIEKPIADSLDGLSELLELAERQGLTLMVGYNLRFHPHIRLMKQLVADGAVGTVYSARVEAGQYLPDWHPWADYREGYSARADLGGGVVLDLSHELDYIIWLLGQPRTVTAMVEQVSPLEIDTEDLAEILIRFESGAVAGVHLDYLQRSGRRSCQLIGETGTILWDEAAGLVKLFSCRTGAWQEFPLPPGTDDNQTYLEELEHFVDCVRRGVRPLITGQEGRAVLKVALAAKSAARTGLAVGLSAADASALPSSMARE